MKGSLWQTILSLLNPPQKPMLSPVADKPKNPFEGFKGTVPAEYAQLILNSSQANNVDPALLAAVLNRESRFDPKALSGNDRGIAQINKLAHPNVSDEQALDPNFAIQYAAKILSDNIKRSGNISRGVAAYNVGYGGASVKGKNPFGGGPKGQTYINKVSENLTPDIIKALGIITGSVVE